MKRLLILLVLFSSLYATTGICNFAPDPLDPEATESFEEAMALIPIAIGVSAAIVALAYMIGKMTSNANLLVFSKGELTHLLVTILLTVTILSFFEGSCHFFTAFLDSPFGPLEQAQNQMFSLQVEGQMIVEQLLSHSVKEKFEGAQVYGYMAPFIGGETAYPYSYHNAYSRQYEVLADMATVGYVSAGVQYYLLHIIEKFIFPLFLPLGLILRAFPFVREAGNVILAMTFALLIILPFAYAVNASAADVVIDFCDDDTEKVVDGCDNITGWGRISSFLFQTVFLPNLAIVIFITGATAMIKVAKVIP
ncbi:MAG: hypothetical protein GY852_07335 [bacterium]|nr:hypothetical protein [bacterium]